MDIQGLKAAYSPDKFRAQGHQLVDLLADHLDRTMNDSSEKVIQWHPPENERRFWEAYDPEQDHGQFYQELLKHIIHIHHPKYMGHQISPSLPITGLTSMVSSLLNNGMGIYEMGAAPTAMERVVTDYLCKVVGYSDISRGLLTSGGTLANLTALLSARQHFLKDKNENFARENQLAVMVSTEAHYCIDRAVNIMGLGKKGIILIPTDSNYQIRIDLLQEYYEKALSEGISVFAVVGCAPSTATGIYDDLDAIQKFTNKHGIWLHIDAAHGGAAIFSSRYNTLLDGVSHADSITIDGHKMMMMPGITTALLFRDGQNSHDTFKQEAAYLLEESEEEDWYNLAKRTFECTKHMMSLHWYAALKFYGPELFDDFVTRLYSLAGEFAGIVEEDTEFELVVRPMSNILCFRYTGQKPEEISLNEFNRTLRQNLLENGEYYIVQTKLRDKQYLRTTIMNPFSTADHFRGLLEHIREIAKSM